MLFSAFALGWLGDTDKIDMRISLRFNHNGLILQTYDDSMLPHSPDVNGILLRLKIE